MALRLLVEQQQWSKSQKGCVLGPIQQMNKLFSVIWKGDLLFFVVIFVIPFSA